MMRIGKYLSTIISVIVIFGGVFYGGYYYCSMANAAEEEIVEKPKKPETLTFDLKLLGEAERRIVTIDEIESRIFEIGELCTYEGMYDSKKSVDESRFIFSDFVIPGTKNTITLECTGIVKIGYDITEIAVKVNEDTIYVSLPKPYVADNHIIGDSIKCEEVNTPLNPIEFDQYQVLIDEIEAEGLADLESDGIYDKADENLENIIRNFLREFDDYEIVFM